MDYLEIVLNGFINNREYLDKYFIRKFKEAESQYYVLGEFFKGCLNVVSALNYDWKKQYYSDMKENQECLNHAITINDKDAENQFREQLKEIDECNYSVTLHYFTRGKFTGHLFSEDIKYIALSLNAAFDKLQEQTPATSSETEPPGANQSELKTIKSLNEFQTFIWTFINSIHEFPELDISPKKIGQPVEIDFFELRKNILNETYSIDKLPHKFKNHKLDEFNSLSKVIYECAEYCRDISKDAIDHDEIQEFGYLLLGIYATIEDAIKLLKTEIDIIQSNTETIKSLEAENPHPQIFPNGECWQLFEYWKENAKDIKADLCFVYWQMIEDNLMYKITPTQFTDWLLTKLSINFNGYWKQIYRVNKIERKRLYSMAKLQFQLNKSQYCK